MRRRAVLVLVWALGTIASVALAWFAVSAVGGEVTSTPDAGIAAAPVTDTTMPTSSTSSSSGSPSTTSTTAPAAPIATTAPAPTSTTAAPPATVERRSDVFDSAGGTVGATCTGAAASLDFATPRPGYAAEVHDAGPEKVDVRFDGDERESRVVVRCVDGTPSVIVEEDEDTSGSDDD